MKKGKIKKILALASMGVLALGMPMLLTGCDKDSDDIDFRINGDKIQWQVDGEWKDLASVEEMENLIEQSKEVSTVTYNFNLGKSINTEIDNQLLSVFDKEGFTKSVAEKQDGNLVLKYTQPIKKGNYFDLYDYFEEIGLKDYFLGWYSEDDVKINQLHVVGGDIELTAKWKNDSLSSFICYEQVEYVNPDLYRENEITARIKSRAESSIVSYFNDVREINLNELTIYNNEFYKIGWYYLTETNISHCITVPDTAIDCFETDMINHSNQNFQQFFKTKNLSYFEDVDEYWYRYYTIGDYVIVCDENIEFVYKVDYEKSEATLLRSFTWGGHGAHSLYDGDISRILDFIVKRDGKNYNIKVVNVKHSWFAPHFEIYYKSDNYNAMNPDWYHIGFIVSENVSEEDLKNLFIFNMGDDENFDYSVMMDEEGYSKFGVTLSFYSLKTQPIYKVENQPDEGQKVCVDNLRYFAIRSEIYYYSETKPTDTEYKYWHYDEDGKVEVWDLETE